MTLQQLRIGAWLLGIFLAGVTVIADSRPAGWAAIACLVIAVGARIADRIRVRRDAGHSEDGQEPPS